MEPLEDQLGLDIFFPGCDKYHRLRRLDYLPYELFGLRRVPPLRRSEAHDAMDSRQRENPSCLEEACAHGCIAQVITFWAQGIDMKGQRALYQGVDATPLMWAVLRNHLPVARFLVDQGVDVNEANGIGHTALHWAVSGGSYESLRFLLENGADATQRDKQGFTPYFSAAQGSNLAMLLILCEARPLDARERDADGHSVLHWGAYANSPAICQYLIEHCHIDIDARDNSGRTALVWAAREGYAEVVEYLVAQGARTEVNDTDGYTPLQYATYRHHREAALVLQKHPAAKRNGVTSSVEGGMNARKKWAPGGYVPVAVKRRAGTLRMMLQQPVFLYMALTGVLYVLLSYLCTSIIPPILSYFILGVFFFRNVLWTSLLNFPEQGGGTEASYLQKLGVARTFGESTRGVWLFRNRDPALPCVIAVFLLIQQYAWSRLGLSSMLFQKDTSDAGLTRRSWVEKPYANGEGFILFTSKAHMEQLVVLFLLGTVTISALLCKLTSMRSVHEMNGNLDSSPIWVILRKRLHGWLHPRMFFMERHALIPLRAFYCYERDVVLRRYDGYSFSLDCPIAESNHLYFFIFVNAFACLQWLLFFWSWEQASDLFMCPRTDSFLWSLLLSPWNLLVHALPCADALHAESLPWTPSLSFLRRLLPTAGNRDGVWVLQCSLAAACWFTAVAARQWAAVWRGATRVECANPTAPGSAGGLVRVFPHTRGTAVPWAPPPGSLEAVATAEEEGEGEREREARERAGRGRCVYAEGNGWKNVAAFMLGVAGRKWRNAAAISMSNTPVYTAAPMQEGIV